jgi:hypothetical protein
MRIILYAMLVLLGAGSWIPLPAATKTYANRAGGHASDAEIEQTIRTRLAKSKIGKDGFKARVKAGVVTWEGHTGIPQHKGAATRMAHAAGAAQVVNNIQVDGGSGIGHTVRKAEVKSE